MKTIVLLLCLAAPGWPQFGSSNARRLSGKPLCTATVTTNCIPATDAAGTLAIGNTVLDAHKGMFTATTNANRLHAWHSALAATSTSRIRKVAVLGDSIGQGYYADTVYPGIRTKGWVGLMQSALQSLYRSAGPGFFTTSQGTGWTIAGSWANSSILGPWQDASAYSSLDPYYTVISTSGAANTATLAAQYCDGFDVYVVQSTDTGTAFQVDVDGVSQGTVGGATSVSPTLVKIHVSSTAGNHTLKIYGPSSDNLYLFGVVPTLGVTGVQVLNFSRSGASSVAFGADATKYAFLDAFAPDLVIVSLGYNDIGHGVPASVTIAHVTAIVQHAKSLNASVLILCENSGSAAGADSVFASLYQQYFALAIQEGTGFLSMLDRWGSFASASALGLMYDTTHPSAAGHADYARAVLAGILDPNSYAIDARRNSLITDTGTAILVNTANDGGGFKLQVAGVDSQFAIGDGAATNPQQLQFGYNTVTHVGRIQAIQNGVAYSPLDLNPGGGDVRVPQIKATTGTRYVCVDTAGKLVSSTTACSGT